MTTPKRPRFLIRCHDKSTQNQIDFTLLCSWMNKNVKEWRASNTVISERGTKLGDQQYDCTYKVLYVNDPQTIVQMRLMFDGLIPFHVGRKYIHPGFSKMHTDFDGYETHEADLQC